MPRRLMLTVDVEAQPGRAERDHVRRLIWGEYPEGRGGIGTMMDICDKHDAKITMFVDYCERAIYGDDILDVAREVHRRGHDLQLHSHPEFLDEAFWSSRKLPRPSIMNSATDAQADALVEFLCESQIEAGGEAPFGYRGGGYRYGPAILRALAKHGVALNSSYIAARENQPLKLGRVRQFYWDNGCLEVPVSCINPFLNLTRDFDLNFNASAFSNAQRMLQCMEAFYQQQGEDAIAVMVLHSWSFSKRQENGFFSPPLAENLERFNEFLSLLKQYSIEVISTADAVALAKSGKIAMAPEIPLSRIGMVPTKKTAVNPPVSVSLPAFAGIRKALPEPVKKVARAVRDNLKAGSASTKFEKSASALSIEAASGSAPIEISCGICSTPLSKFENYNGRLKVRCPKCGSVERQRVFVDIYRNFLKAEFDLTTKHILALSPSYAERMIFKEHCISDVITCDIQPNLKTDIVADITNMPEIPDESFDCVTASYVLTCVHDLEAALSEIARILKMNGRFLFCDPLTLNSETVEHSDFDRITNWYGKEAFDQFKIGSFRRLGDLGILKSLQEHCFLTKTFYGRDPITNTNWVWHSAIKSTN